MSKKKKKLDDYFSDNDFDLQIEMGREYYASRKPQRVTIYQVDISESKTHRIYGQARAKDKKILPGIEIVARVNYSNESTNKNNEINRQDIDTFTFNVYDQELNEKNIILKRGDYFSYDHGDKIRFYEIDSINFISDISQTMIGDRPYYKKVVGTPVKEDTIFNQD